MPGHISHMFLRSAESLHQLTFNPVASFVRALNLHKECPPTLLKALANSHPNREVWLQSYQEEKSGLESLNTCQKITLGISIVHSVKKVPLEPFLQCVSSQSSGMKICFHTMPSPASLFWLTTKTGSGPSLINLCLSSGVILSVSLSAWPSNTVALFVKVTAKTHSAKASYLLTRSLSSVHPLVTLTLILKSINYFNAPSMDYNGASATGMTK